MADIESNNEEQLEGLSDQEKIAQTALGNMQVSQPSTDNNDGLRSLPKTSGTGSNPASAAANSLIVHGGAGAEDRYEEGGAQHPGEEKDNLTHH